MNKYSKKSKVRKSKNFRKTKRTQQKKTKKSRRTLRLIRNKRGGGGFAPWVGSHIESLDHNSARFRQIEQQYDRNNGCLLMSCHQW